MPTVYDSTNALDIPVTPPGEGAFMAGYADGRWPSYSEMVARYPLATIFSIAVGYGTHAYWCDRETLDLSPQQAALQIKNQFSTGIYVDSSSWPAVESAVASLSLPIPPYWIAQYDGDPTLPVDWIARGCIWKQYQSVSPGNYDVSSTIPGFHPGPPPIPEDAQVISVINDKNGSPQVYYIASNGDVIQLSIYPSGWTVFNFTTQAGAPLAAV